MRQIAIVTEPGLRPTMEDKYYCLDVRGDGSCIFAGVYDGHGGVKAAEYTKDYLHEFFFQEIKAGRSIEQAFKIAYEKISCNLASQDSGTTAVDFYLKDNTLWYANAGDVRLIVVRESWVKQLSQVHRLTNSKEKRRIVKAGGVLAGDLVVKGDLGLMPTRSLGDEYFKDIGIIATPFIGHYRLKPQDSWILAATDGLFDYIDNQEVAEFIVRFDQADLAAAGLKQEVLVKRGGSDNLTLILIKNNS